MSSHGDVTAMPAALAETSVLKNVLQVAAIMQISLVAGATFGIWRGLGGAQLSAASFIDMHQALVDGLNVLLPAMGATSALLAAILAYLARRHRPAVYFYLAAFVLTVGGGLVTRFWNQPINAQVMEWTVQTIPADWMEIRDFWWRGHIVRTFLSIGAAVAIIVAMKTDRPARR